MEIRLMESLHLYSLTGMIPSEVGMLRDLHYLNMCSVKNVLGPLPSELGLCTNLEVLDISFCNGINGKTPDSFGNLSMLREITTGNYVDLTGNLPEGFYSWESIQILDLTSNDLSGTLSPQIANLVNLEVLNCYNEFRCMLFSVQIPRNTCPKACP
jgi:hypothetical protein